MDRRTFLIAAASMGLTRRSWALPVSDGIFGDVADAILDRARLETLDKELAHCTRYLTLSGLPPDYDLLSAYAGLSFWVNSLSTNPSIRPPRQVTRTLFAVDPRDYCWQIEAWDELTKQDGYYFLPAKEGCPGSLILRADFFCNQTSITTRSKSYYDFLFGLGKAPKNAQELRDRFRVRLEDAREIRKERGVAIKKHDSGVASNNRLIKYARTVAGDYWQTFDTKTSAGNQNLPAHLNLKGFHADAGEIIFSLPNELHGFLLVNGKEERVEFADPEVVKVPFLFNSRRCVDCHRAQGILTPKAIIPEWVKVGVDLDSQDQKTRDWFEAFYYGDPQGIAIRGAQERYQNAAVQCWATAPGKDVAETAAFVVDGFIKLCEWYNRPLLLKQACHELGYSAQQVQRALQDHKTTNVGLPALGADEAYPRDDWEANGFRQLRSVLKEGGY